MDRQQDENEKLQNTLAKSVDVVTDLMMDSINSDVAVVFQNQKLIEIEAKQLEAEANKLSKNAKKWVELLGTLQSSLKELGDVENWAQTIEADINQ